MKKKNILALTIAAAGLALAPAFTSCTKNIFDKKDQNGINEDIWDTEGAVNLYLNRTYDLIMPTWPVAGAIHNTSDEMNNANTTFLYGQLVGTEINDIASGNSATTNRYFDIRRCNIAIEGLDSSKTLTPAVKANLKGQFHFFRALVYFNLVRLYGGVPLILKAQEINENLQVPRAKTSEVVEAIVRDLDSCYGLPAGWPSAEQGKITKGAALALKGKVLMYWASAQFNPSNDPARWERAYQANKAAYDTCKANGYALNPNFGSIFIDESSSNKEPILIRKHDAISISPGRGTNVENVVRPLSETTGGSGSYQPTWNLVQAFTMNNGLPITNANSGYNSTLFWSNRDPRFEATVAYNGAAWPLSGKSGRKQWNYVNVGEDNANQSKTGFYTKKISNPSISATAALYNSNSGGGSGMDWIEMRFAEVLVNLAECANETDRLAEAKDLIRLLRQRAGIVAGGYDYGLAVATNKAEMADLIMNERMVEFAMEGKRYHDLRRTRRFHLLTGTIRQGFRWTAKDPFIAGTVPANKNASKIYLEDVYIGAKVRDTININNVASYTKAFTTATFSLDATNPITFPANYYFYPLPSGFLSSSYAIEQTTGWPGGTFDPLQ